MLFITLLLMISFASVNAVLFTPALPDIAHFFNINNDAAQLTISWFLIGYALGQLLYGPIANRYGRKPALYVGISIQIISSLLCAYAGTLADFNLLVIGRFLLALGSGVGLKITFTLVNETCEPKVASQKMAYLMLGFAITPGLSVALGGILNAYLGWQSCFYAGVIYGIILLLMATKLPETLKVKDKDALRPSHLIHSYAGAFKNSKIFITGLLMGACTSFVYVFAAEGPFVAIKLLHMNSAEYGLANILPGLGLITGSLIAARLAKIQPLITIVRFGSYITCVGVFAMIASTSAHLSALMSLFIPMILIYVGLSFMMANASSLAMSHIADKAHGAAVMNFLNMGLATVVVLSLGFFPISLTLIPLTFLCLCGLILLTATRLGRKS